MAAWAASLVEAGTPGGLLLAVALLLPFAGVLVALVLGGRWPERTAIGALIAGVPVVWAIGAVWLEQRWTIAYALGGWSPPLGIALRADGLAVAMLVTTVVVMLVIALYARADFATPRAGRDTRAAFSFWTLLLAVWGSLNLLFLASDLFTLYVGLELVTFAAVPLVSLDGRSETLQAALRYLLFALAGSILYLAGAVIVYGVHGTLDVALLAQRVEPDVTMAVAMALMTAGLAAKTALFPLHLWLPPAHAGAPAAASALLSALVIKGSFFVVVRLWFNAMPAVPGPVAAQIVGALGAGAILVGGVVALRQSRLKLLIAYSTVAQIGYLFLAIALAMDAGTGRIAGGAALAGGMLQAVSHATAKAAMFMSAGLLYAALGHDRVADLAGAARLAPMSVAAFGLGAVSLMGLPPSGGFVAKWWLLSAAMAGGQWWWAAVILVGGLLTAAYLLMVIARAMAEPAESLVPHAAVPRHREAAALALALVSAGLGLGALADTDAAAMLGARP
jgi:formate hydrogenlyase subunit 3/multisubunit Na+/H+ antiporter MnhD subunit